MRESERAGWCGVGQLGGGFLDGSAGGMGLFDSFAGVCGCECERDSDASMTSRDVRESEGGGRGRGEGGEEGELLEWERKTAWGEGEGDGGEVGDGDGEGIGIGIWGRETDSMVCSLRSVGSLGLLGLNIVDGYSM